MSSERSKKAARPAPRQPDSPRRDAISRLICIAFLLFLAYMLGTLGLNIQKTGGYDYQLDTGDVSGGSAGGNVKHEEVHVTDPWAMEQGRGFVAVAVPLVVGIFSWILLAAHPLMLIPKMRAELWTPGEKGGRPGPA